MTTPDERRQQLSEVRKMLGEAVTARGMTDEESELASLAVDLAEHQRQLEQLTMDDLVGVVWFGGDDAWLDSRLGSAGGDDA